MLRGRPHVKPRRYRATCRQQQTARAGADAAARAQADLRHEVDEKAAALADLEAKLRAAKQAERSSATAAGALEREVEQSAGRSEADQRTVDALRAEIARLRGVAAAAPPLRAGGASATMPTMPSPMMPPMMPTPDRAGAAAPRHASPGDRIDALLAQARMIQAQRAVGAV